MRRPAIAPNACCSAALPQLSIQTVMPVMMTLNRQYLAVMRMMALSWPFSPTLDAPIMMVEGAMETPIDPPSDCAAANKVPLLPSSSAVSYCNAPNMMLELVLLPVIKVPSTPTTGASRP